VQAAIELNTNYNPDDPEDPMSKSAYNKFFSKYGYEDYLTGLDEYNTRIERFNKQAEMAQKSAYSVYANEQRQRAQKD
jgi:putative hemolysin